VGSEVSVADILREIKKRHKWTGADLARAMGVSITSASRVLNGHHGMRPTVFASLAEHLDEGEIERLSDAMAASRAPNLAARAGARSAENSALRRQLADLTASYTKLAASVAAAGRPARTRDETTDLLRRLLDACSGWDGVTTDQVLEMIAEELPTKRELWCKLRREARGDRD